MKEHISNFNKAKADADPTQYSELPKLRNEFASLDPNEKRQNAVLKDKVSGEKYHEIRDSVALQMFVAHLVKGIVAVSDIVPVEPGLMDKMLLRRKEFYSKENDLSKIEENRGFESMNADRAFMLLVFGDNDHEFLLEEEYKNEDNLYVKSMKGDIYHNHNLDKQTGAHTMFDFNEAGFIFNRSPLQNKEASKIYIKTLDKLTVSETEMLLERLRQFAARISGDSGYIFFNAIVEKVLESRKGARQSAEGDSDPVWTAHYEDIVSRKKQYDNLCKEVEVFINFVQLGLDRKVFYDTDK